jgi:hypothetical protein
MTRAIKSRRMRKVGHGARMGNNRNVYGFGAETRRKETYDDIKMS